MLDQECIFVYLDLISFNTLFPVYKSYTIFVMFIPKYFLFSWELFVIGIDFLISISDCSFLVYRNTVDFCVLIYNRYTALQSWWTRTLIVFHGFLKIFLSVRPCHLKTNNFSSLGAFSFSCLIALAGFFSRMLKRRGQSKHPCLVPDPRGIVFSL